MPTYRRSRTLQAGEERVFEYLADIRNLPRYVDRITSARSVGGDTVAVTAEEHGQTERGEAWLRVDRTARRIQWGSEEGNDYSGTLDLHADQDRTVVDLEVQTERTQADEINRSMDATLDRIQEQIEADHARKGTAG
ncbi:MAG: SRPBCC family protein [Labedaea sp.]